MSAADDLDDGAVVERVVSGQANLFRVLVERHQRAVYGMGLSFFRDSDEAADFTQDVFLKAYKNLPGFRRQARFSTWLYRIAYNTAVNGVKRRRDFLGIAENAEFPDYDGPERQTLRKAAAGAVVEAVAGLPERFRVCVDLFFFYDRSYQEIEAITSIPVNTVKSHVFRAKKILRERLRDYAEGGVE